MTGALALEAAWPQALESGIARVGQQRPGSAREASLGHASAPEAGPWRAHLGHIGFATMRWAPAE